MGSRPWGKPAAGGLWTEIGAGERKGAERKLGREREKQYLSPLSASHSLILARISKKENKREKVRSYIPKKERE